MRDGNEFWNKDMTTVHDKGSWFTLMSRERRIIYCLIVLFIAAWCFLIGFQAVAARQPGYDDMIKLTAADMEAQEEEEAEAAVLTGSRVILVVGCDNRGKHNVGLTDTIMLVFMDMDEKKVDVIKSYYEVDNERSCREIDDVRQFLQERVKESNNSNSSRVRYDLSNRIDQLNLSTSTIFCHDKRTTKTSHLNTVASLKAGSRCNNQHLIANDVLVRAIVSRGGAGTSRKTGKIRRERNAGEPLHTHQSTHLPGTQSGNTFVAASVSLIIPSLTKQLRLKVKVNQYITALHIKLLDNSSLAGQSSVSRRTHQVSGSVQTSRLQNLRAQIGVAGLGQLISSRLQDLGREIIQIKSKLTGGQLNRHVKVLLNLERTGAGGNGLRSNSRVKLVNTILAVGAIRHSVAHLPAIGTGRKIRSLVNSAQRSNNKRIFKMHQSLLRDDRRMLPNVSSHIKSPLMVE